MKTRTFLYTVNVWLKNRTIIGESYFIRDGIDDLSQTIQRLFGDEFWTFDITNEVEIFEI